MDEMRGDGTVYRQPGSKFWWISYWKDGKRKRESSRSEEFKSAHNLLNQRRASVSIPASALPVSTPETVTIAELVSDLLAWYLSENPRPRFRKDSLSRWDLHLKTFFADLKASALGTSHLRAYRVKRTQEKASFATINRELQILRKAYKLAFESEPPKVQRVPSFKGSIPKERNARMVFIDPLLAQKMKEAAAKEGLWARVFLEMAFTLGWRRSELQELRVGNIWLSEGTVRIEKSKNEESREVPMTEALRILVQPLVAGRSSKELLWPVKSFRGAWKRICTEAGVKSGKVDGYVLHDTRRTSTRTKRAAGVPETVIMNLHGWKSSAMVQRYGIVEQEDRLRALVQEEKFIADARARGEKAKQNATEKPLPYMAPAKIGNA